MFNLSASTSHKSLLLGGASFAAMLLMAPMANATTFSGMTGMNVSQVPNTVATKPVSGPIIKTPGQAAAQTQATTDFSSALARIQAQLSAQAAQHNAQVNIPSTNVPDGLAVGGLNPVANPVRAAQDTTGLVTWEGASAPSQTTDASGNANVTIHQSQKNAILSWQTFNVGKKTTLNFDQQGNKDWVALNRVAASTAPSQILGNIKADGTVLVINQNGIIFGGSSQVNVNSLIASTLEIGQAIQPNVTVPIATLAQRDQTFLENGLFSGSVVLDIPSDQVSPVLTSTGAKIGNAINIKPSSILIDDGAQITSGDSGYILMASQTIDNGGHLAASNGQVILAAADQVILQTATGAADGTDPGIRGFLAGANTLGQTLLHSVANDATGLIESPQGSIILTAGGTTGTVVNAGVLSSTTSVSRNGAIEISGANIEIAPASTISITPDNSGGTVPQDPTSIADFKPSEINIGNFASQVPGVLVGQSGDQSASIDIGAGALILAPSGNIAIGALPGATVFSGSAQTIPSRVFVDTGAIIDAAGLENVQVPASQNTIVISPVKGNELAESPLLRNSFLNGATVTLDPRLSGVRDDGVAWIGSPLIDATSYYQQVGVSVSQLMTKGGNVTLGTDLYNGTNTGSVPNIVVKSGAVINIAGGWVTYPAGKVDPTRLIDSSGHIVDIGYADPNDTYVGIYDGFAVDHNRWGIRDVYSTPLLVGSYHVPEYSEGRDAGALFLSSSAVALDGMVDAEVFPGPLQNSDAQVGTGTSTVSGDFRQVQAAPSQLPAGGMLSVGSEAAAANILVENAADYQALPSSLSYGQTVTIASDGSGTVIVPAMRDPASILTTDQLGTIALSDSLLSGSGFSQVSLQTSGTVKLAANANVSLNPGGVFNVAAGHAVTIDGTISAPSGTINLTTYGGLGSPFAPDPTAPQPGDFDIIIDGRLSTAGRWVNDFGLDGLSEEGGAYLNGGSITLYAAPRVSSLYEATGQETVTPDATNDAVTNTDLSGSILINSGSLLDVSSGGRIDRLGNFDLTAKGGNVSLYDETAYFQIADLSVSADVLVNGALDALRVDGLSGGAFGASQYAQVNPDQTNSRVLIAPGTIRAQGFGGGGTFTLTTPEFAFSDDASSTASSNATRLPLSFFSEAGFANYDITSYKTDIFANPFNNTLGGYDALLATQTLTVGAGQNLNLTQSMLPGLALMSSAQRQGLLNLASGGDVFSVVSAAVPTDAWYRQAANLTLGGLLDLDIAQGGSVTGDAGANLTVAGLLNQGTIRIAGGTITQAQDLPLLYTEAGTEAVHSLSDIFTVNPDGTIDENALSKVSDGAGGFLTNAQLAGTSSSSFTEHPIYLLDKLDAGVGIVLAPGSVTDLSGTSIRNPDAYDSFGNPIATGRMVAGGTLQSEPNASLPGQTLFRPALNSVYASLANASVLNGSVSGDGLDLAQQGQSAVLDAGATVNLSGASDIYDEPTTSRGLTSATSTVATPVWSDAGTLSTGAGVTLTGAIIDAHGGAPQAENGTLVMLDPVLAQNDPSTPTANVVSADMITAAGFDTLVALGSVSNQGDATITLGRGFFLEGRPIGDDGDFTVINTNAPNTRVPTLRSTGGTLTIDAPYVDFSSNFDTIVTPAIGTAGADGAIVFNAQDIDVTGVLLADQSVANTTFNATGDIRLTGVAPWQQTYFTVNNPVNTLNGMIAANGNLTFNAGQIYPTTGSSFAITSTALDGNIVFGRTGTVLPAAPYTAGGNLFVQAANIVQGGVIRVPLGTLTLGSNTDDGSGQQLFAPATQSVTLADGSVTSVSANGLIIPYGTTTDQTEWYFTPTDTNPLTAPPQKLLQLNGATVTTEAGATVDLTGGGDVYAYEFVPGTGGSRDVLNQLNPDTFTSNNGYQYPDQRQVYAIVPGLSSNPLPAYDPVYDANYSALTGSSQAGKRVYLNGGNGLAAGWYTLLPAQYAMLPGGMRVVEETGNPAVAGLSDTLPNGTLITTGMYGDALSGASQSQLRVFSVQSQAVINTESNIAITTGTTYFTNLAAHNGAITPSLAADAGRMVLNPTATLIIDPASIFDTSPATGGRGSEVDIGGSTIDILASLDNAPSDGALHVTATSLTSLGAASLLIGGTRTDNDDGTTSLNVTANSITVANDATTPLSVPDLLLATDGTGSGITLNDGAVITAQGTFADPRTGDYLIAEGNGGQTGRGALLRVSNGPQRLATRTYSSADASGGLQIGAATLTGNAVLLDSADAFTIADNTNLNAQNLALSAPTISFAPDAQGLSGLVITPGVAGKLAATNLTLRSPAVIGFAPANYAFGGLTLDAPGVAVSDAAGNVTIDAGAVALRDSSGSDAGTCIDNGNCGTGTFALNAQTLTFLDTSPNVAFRIYGAGNGVTLSAPGGMFVQGQANFDVGGAPLTLLTPYFGDQAGPAPTGTTPEIPSLAVTTTGAIALSNPTNAAVPTVTNMPGASISFTGNGITVDGVDVRATGGTLTLTSSNGIAINAGATLEAPGYSHNFGDNSDPYVVSAPGGFITLNANNGDIDLASGSAISLGGDSGNGGSITLNAANGQVNFAGTVTGAPGGASLTVNTGGAFDLSTFAAANGSGFNGDIAIESGTGNLTLASGDSLKATDVSLTADGGLVDIAGIIDVSGINGGNVDLFGTQGVTLESTAQILARASGYGPTDTRQASAGNVTLGSGFISSSVNAGGYQEGITGPITIASGAVIDVSALNPQARIVEGDKNGFTTYNYVAGDQGGTVTLRAPLIGPDGAESVNVSVADAGSIKGADSVVLEGYRAYDLAAIGAGGQFVGVDTTSTPGTAILDTTASGGVPNFLADEASGTIPTFIQTFDISSSYGNLGGLASQSNFHARPGVELDYNGDITLASNWNFAAGVVNEAGAEAAGLMTTNTATGEPAIIAGDEAAILAGYTHMLYRVETDNNPLNVLGEPGVLSIRATGNLNIGEPGKTGSITDGFFTFGDQTDPNYLNSALGAGAGVYNVSISPSCNIANCVGVTAFTGANPLRRFNISFAAPTYSLIASSANLVPYDAAANTPGALGSGAGGQGDPIGSADIFPLIQGPNGLQAVNSWSYQLTGGAKSSSANPAQVQANATGGVTVQGTQTYTFGGSVSGSGTLSSSPLQFNVGGSLVDADQLEAAVLATPAVAGTNLGASIATTISTSFGNIQDPTAQAALQQALQNFFSGLPSNQYLLATSGGVTTSVSTSLGVATQFIQYLLTSPAWQQYGTSDFSAPSSSASLPTVTATTQTLIRSGTGSINLAAAGNIDLRGNGSDTPTIADSGFQRGGVPIYTAGVPVTPGPVTAIDTTTGLAVTLDPSAFAVNGDYVGTLNYGYGAANGAGVTTGLTGVLVSNTQYLDGGGDITIEAGADVLGRRDADDESLITGADRNVSGGATAIAPFIGFGDQPWRTGSLAQFNNNSGSVTDNANPAVNLLVDPQMFLEGLGALGGGNVTVHAGGNVSDLSIVSDTSVTTGAASGGVIAGQQFNRGQITFGGGNVIVTAAGNLLGSRIDVASGQGNISVGGSIKSAGQVETTLLQSGLIEDASIDNTLRLRLTDATFDMTAHGDITLEGIKALGVQNWDGRNGGWAVSNGYAANFYSPNAGVSLVSDGSVTLQDAGDAMSLAETSADMSAQHLAILPGSLTAVGLTGDVTLAQPPVFGSGAFAVLLSPSPTGELVVAAGTDVSGTTIAMLDNQPTYGDAIPSETPNMSDAQRETLHDPSTPHQNDSVPNRIYAGNDIDNLILYVPKQTRVGAGEDIVNMMFFGQNLNPTDITRITAGRDITATNVLAIPAVGATAVGAPEPAVEGNTFIIGGPGTMMIEAGRDLGPFLNSATIGSPASTYAGGILAVGNEWNPWLPQVSAGLDVMFGVAGGADYNALREAYVDPANLASMPDYLFAQQQEQEQGGTLSNTVSVADRSRPIYGAMLVSWMQSADPAVLKAAYGTTNVSYDQAYAVFITLPQLLQHVFLDKVYFNELQQTANQSSVSYLKYSRGYQAVNTLFPASDGYTQNDLTGGSNGANKTVETGNLDLRLATIQTDYGSDVDIMGPGGSVLAGSTVRTSAQAARRTYDGVRLYAGNDGFVPGGPIFGAAITSIPPGYEGVLTLRGGAINTFTDGDFLLNQSRLFTEEGGDITMWSSNADLNAGQGPKTSADFPPVVVKVSTDLFVQPDQAGATTGAGIAALQATPDSPPSNVYLIAPRGTVDAGDAGIRVSGNLSIAALAVANADNIQVKGQSFGLPPQPVTNLTLTTASTAATEAASIANNMRAAQPATTVDVEVTGFGGDFNQPDLCVPSAGNSCSPGSR